MEYEYKGTQPMKVAVQEGKEKAFEEFPGLKQQELDTVNDYYDHYIFYEKSGGGRKFWSSCCHQEKRFLSMTTEMEITPAVRDALCCRHGSVISCPFCGKNVELKAKGTAKNCKGLETYIPVIFLSTADSGQTIYAQAYWTNKDYDHNWATEPLYMATYVYRFRRGEAVQWVHSYGDVWYRQVNGFLQEPFRSGSYLFIHYDDYQVIGMECLKESFLKYIDFTVCKNRRESGWWNLMRFLSMAAQYPENVEMLQKAGMTDVLDDWTRRQKKNAANIVWGEKDPRKAFRLDGGELKAFMATQKRSVSVLTLYKRAKKQKAGLTMADCQGIEDALGWSAEKELPKVTKEYGATIKELTHYLKRQTDRGRTFGMAFRTWKDYMTAAEAMEMRIYREDVKFPKDLWTAHEEVTEQNRKRLEKEHRMEMRKQQAAEKKRQEEQAERERLALLAYADRKKGLEKRYGYAAEGLMIRVPENREEIVAEGKALQHCVGGYADRHIDGAVTILFLRKESAPDKPFLTVEMNGDKLVQIHGYKNEGMYTTKGRFAPDPREVYKDFLDPWLDWVAKGSRRNKNGEPVRSRQKVEVQIA